jgi:type IV pilus assembly protein PilM
MRGSMFLTKPTVTIRMRLSSVNRMPAGQQPMLLVAAPKELVDTMLEIGDGLGLIPLSVDIEVLSCYRVLKEQLTDFVLLDIGRGYSLITIFQGGAPVAQRSIPHGSQMFDSAIADSVGCSLEEAEQTKKGDQYPGRRRRSGAC